MPSLNSRRVLFGVAIVTVGAIVAAISLVRVVPAEDATTTFAYRQTLAPRRKVGLSVDGQLGAGVRVYGWNKNSVDLDVRSRGDYANRVVLTHENDRDLHVRFRLNGTRTVPSLFHLHDTHIELVAHVPRHATLSVSVINGAVDVTGVTGPLSVTNVNGPIRVAESGSVLSLHCKNGPVSAYISDLSAVPDIDISTLAGPVEVRVPARFRAEIDVHTLVGPLEDGLRSTRGPGRLRASSKVGPVSVGYD